MTRTESEPAGASGSGTVVLELGPGSGALILLTPLELNGHEIDISPAETHGRRTHSVVRPRQVTGGTQYAAVYPSLPPGSYTIWPAPAGPIISVTITGGAVTIAEVDQPSPRN